MLRLFSHIHTIAVFPQQTLQQRTEALWSELELHYACLRQSLRLIDREEKSEVEKDWEHLAQQWRNQQVALNSRCVQLLEIVKMLSTESLSRPFSFGHFSA